MMLRILHFFIGHDWIDWKIRGILKNDQHGGKIWWESTCSCGKVKQAEFTDDTDN